jgi:hypothetical protein
MTFCPLVPPHPVIIGDGRSTSATGIGRVCVDVDIGEGKWLETILQDIYYVPKLDGNLLSVLHLTNKGFDVDLHKIYLMHGHGILETTNYSLRVLMFK